MKNESPTVNQGQKELGERLVISPENLEKIMNVPIIPPIDEMLLEALSHNYIEPFVPPIEVD